ncbi:Uncharacterised protein [Mycobacteroides abscessus subsp. abscessus]|nr:Uncharacterised protein [Mycobacteroides abscessus subsp. abscessus]
MGTFKRHVFEITKFDLLCARSTLNRLLIMCIQTIFADNCQIC